MLLKFLLEVVDCFPSRGSGSREFRDVELNKICEGSILGFSNNEFLLLKRKLTRHGEMIIYDKSIFWRLLKRLVALAEILCSPDVSEVEPKPLISFSYFFLFSIFKIIYIYILKIDMRLYCLRLY